MAPAQNAREAHRDPGFVPGRAVHAFEAQFEDVMRRDRTHRAEALKRVRADPAVEFEDFGIVQTRIGFGHRHQRLAVPHAEGVVGVQRAAAAVPGLRVQQHRVDGQRIDFPFPPVAATATGSIRRVAAFQHQAFHAARARCFAQDCGGGPVAHCDRRRQRDPRLRIGAVGPQRFQQRAPFAQRPLAQVFAVEFQQVVGDHLRGMFAQRFRARFQPLDARLQRSERGRRVGIGVPNQQLAVEHRIARQSSRSALDFGKTAVEAFFAARPQRQIVIAPDQLQADAVPLPFKQPVVDVAQRCGLRFQRRRQKKRIRLRAIAGQRFAAQQIAQEGLIRRPLAQHPLREQRDVDARQFGQRLLHQPLRYAHPQRAGEQFVEHQTLLAIEMAPAVRHRIASGDFIPAGDRQQTLLDPHMQRRIVGVLRIVQQQRQGFGQVADLFVARFDQPRRRGAFRGDPRAQFAAAGDLGLGAADLAARQQPQRPHGVARRGVAEVIHQRRAFVQGRGAAVEAPVEIGEASHQSSPLPSSPP